MQRHSTSRGSRRDRKKGTYSGKKLRITPARSHPEQGSNRNPPVCIPLHSKQWTNRNRVFAGRERAEVSHAPRSPPTRIGISSQRGIHKPGTFQESRKRPENLSTQKLELGTSNRRGNGTSRIIAYYYVDPATLPIACTVPSADDKLATTPKPFPIRYSGSALLNRLQRWQLLHRLRNGSLTLIRRLLQSKSRREFLTLPDLHRPP
jgi:hypothetical protein